ncbi:MAG: RtcB family protein, partial [Myxococcota bacterium]
MKPLIIRTPKSWIEGEAESQLEKVSRLPGMHRVVGMPDLHPGKGSPVGAAFFSTDRVYPYLVGNDIGCGMALLQTDAKSRALKLDKLERKVRRGDMEGPWDGDAMEWLERFDVQPAGYERSLGTVGGGNHFAELLRVKEVVDRPRFESAGLHDDRLLLLVHSGSRGLGEEILRGHVDQHQDSGLDVGSEAFEDYITKHDQAVS